MRKQDEVPEGDDHAAVGKMLHTVLQRAFTPYVGKSLSPGDITPEQLSQIFKEEMAKSSLGDSLPPQSRFMLEAAGPKRLRDFLEHQPEHTEILQLEQEISACLDMGGRRFELNGTIDRLDRREEGLVILDYKSGRTSPAPRASFWHDAPLWQAMREWQPGLADPLQDLADSLPSLQLPCYLYICRHDPQNAALLRLADLADAAWVQLAEKGEELSLLGEDADQETRQTIIDQRIPELLSFVLRHMAEAEAFEPRPSERCKWCPYAGTCSRLPQKA